MSKIIFFLIILIILISFNIYAQEFDLKEDDIEIETSIVLLNIYKEENIVQSNYFFEILNFEDKNYILIPINLLSNTVDLEIIYDRLGNLIIIKNPINDKLVKINLQDKTYIDLAEFNNEPPIIYGNDFFVSSSVIAYLFNGDVNWNSNYQELSITGDFKDDELEVDVEDQEEKKKIMEEENINVIQRKDKFSLGSINYKFQIDYRDRNIYSDTLTLSEVMSIFGRVGNWALTLREEGEIDLYNNNTDFEIPYFKGEYQDENKLIIIGDSKFSFDNTIGKKVLRGLYFRVPDKLAVDIIPMIDISGKTVPNSIVELFVNNNSPIELEVENDGKYYFEDVELRLQVLNRIRIVITKPNNEIEIIDKKITATEKILNEGTSQLEVLGGVYKNSSSNEKYDGLIAGFRGGYALNKNISLQTEASFYDTRYLENNEKYISSNINLAYRLINNTIVSLDWYYGDYNGKKESGYKANVHYAFNRGYLDAYYIYINENLSKLIDESSGKEQRVMGVYSLNENWVLEPILGVYESLDIDSPLKRKYIRLSLKGKNGWANNIAFTGSYENIEKDYLLTSNNTNYLLPSTTDRYGAGFDYRQLSQGYKLNVGGNLYDNTVKLPNNYEIKYKNIDYNVDFYKILTDSLLFTINYNTAYDDYGESVQNKDEETRLRIRYNILDNTFFTLSGKKSLKHISNYEENRYSAIINTYINNNLNIYGKYSAIEISNNIDYKELSLDIGYGISNNSGYINIFSNYIIPELEVLEPQIGYGLGYNYLFENQAQLQIEGGKRYQSFSSSNYEHYFSITYSHAMSFSANKNLRSRYNSSSHRSFVAGYVYLDENNNGKYDKGEETLPNIEMRLDNITATTNEDGLFRFDPLFSDNYILDFNYRRLSADYTPISKEKLVILRENENIFENFGLTLNGSISGKIFLDKNNNGIQDLGEDSVSWVGVTLDGEKYDYTDKRGEFYFENVSLGNHNLEVIKESLPSSLTFSNEMLNQIIITIDDLDVKDIIIPLYYRF